MSGFSFCSFEVRRPLFEPLGNATNRHNNTPTAWVSRIRRFWEVETPLLSSAVSAQSPYFFSRFSHLFEIVWLRHTEIIRLHNHCMQTVPSVRKSLSASNVPSKRTRPERLVAAVLLKMGYRFKQNVASLPGTPDVVIEGTKKVIFVHGCFWHRHGCRKSSTPKTNTDFWIRKFARNVKRDKKVIRLLKRRGFEVLVLWECKLSDSRGLFKCLRRFLTQRKTARRTAVKHHSGH